MPPGDLPQFLDVDRRRRRRLRVPRCAKFGRRSVVKRDRTSKFDRLRSLVPGRSWAPEAVFWALPGPGGLETGRGRPGGADGFSRVGRRNETIQYIPLRSAEIAVSLGPEIAFQLSIDPDVAV